MLVLASQSPRRREILTAAGIDFVVRAVTVPEQHRPGEPPEAYVLRLSEEKARAAESGHGDIVLGADTVVVAGGQILEQLRDGAHAARMLAILSGREHDVITGICLLQGNRKVVDLARTRVHFAAMSERDIEEYVASGEPMDKAGAYAIQGLASKFIDRIEGEYCNVVGLPIALVYPHLQSW